MQALRHITISAVKVLRAMDLPDGSFPAAAAHPVLVSLARVKGALHEETGGAKAGRGGEAASAGGEAGGGAAAAAAAAAAAPPSSPGFWSRLALSIDGFWRVFGIDLCALSLLVAALMAANAASLVYLVLMGLAASGQRVS